MTPKHNGRVQWLLMVAYAPGMDQKYRGQRGKTAQAVRRSGSAARAQLREERLLSPHLLPGIDEFGVESVGLVTRDRR